MASEVNKGNVQMMYKPGVCDSHHRARKHSGARQAGRSHAAGIGKSILTDFHVEKFYFGTGLFTSSAAGRSAGTNLYVGQRIGHGLGLTRTGLKVRPKMERAAPSCRGPCESFSSRFSLLQYFTHRRTDYICVWWRFHQQPVDLRADYQNVYLPFRPTAVRGRHWPKRGARGRAVATSRLHRTWRRTGICGIPLAQTLSVSLSGNDGGAVGNVLDR